MSVDGQFILFAANEVGFGVGDYDKSRPLVIDPVLSFSTYLSGSAIDAAGGIAVDAAGNAYVTGTTYSTDFPITKGAFQSNCGPSDYPCNYQIGGISAAFVSKLSPSGSLRYSTYIGGRVGNHGYAIAVDSSGNTYITGATNSPDFPVTIGAFQTQCKTYKAQNSCSGAFVTKLNPTGSALVYSTYLGGSADEGRGIAVDSSGNAYVGGFARSKDFPTTPGALQTRAPGLNNGHGFVSKLNPAGSALVYSTYLGGTGADQVNAVAVDAAGNAYVTGLTEGQECSLSVSDRDRNESSHQTDCPARGPICAQSATGLFAPSRGSACDYWCRGWIVISRWKPPHATELSRPADV